MKEDQEKLSFAFAWLGFIFVVVWMVLGSVHWCAEAVATTFAKVKTAA